MWPRLVPAADVTETALADAAEASQSMVSTVPSQTSPIVTGEPDSSLDRVLFDEAPVGLAFLDPDLRYVRLNAALARINGLPVEAHLGRTALELWPDLDPRVFDGLRQVLATGVPIEGLQLEAVTPADPGVPHTYIHAYHPVRGPEGRIRGLNCSVVDVTERRHAEVEARRAREAARLLAALNARLATGETVDEVAMAIVEAARDAFGAITAGLFLVDAAERNLVAAGSVGYTLEIVASFGAVPLDAPSPAADALRSRSLLVWPDLETLSRDHPTIAAAMRDVTGERAVASTPLLAGDRAIGALHLGFPIPYHPTEAERADLQAIGDVSAQAIVRIRLAEAERRARRMLEATIEQMPLGVILADASGEVLIGNAESRRIWHGYHHQRSVDDMAGYRAFDEDGRPYPPGEWPLSRSIATGEVIHGEDVRIETFDGRRRTVEDSSAPIRDDDGTIIGGVVVFSDVTEKRRAADIRDTFLGVLSHELRTPVTSIYGAATLLASRERTLHPDVRRGLEEDMEAEANRLLRIVDNLLVLARAERGATVIEAAPLMLDRLVRRIVESEERGWPTIEVSVSSASPLPPVLADEALVEVVVRNLVGNAGKYAPGPVEVAIERSGDYVTLAVRDRGPGIADADLERIFELFERGSGKAVASGSGIGLFVVRHLAEAMGGRSWAANRPGGGAEVGVALPLDPDAFEPDL